ncbi:AAA family ATPase [Kitasatospora sp. NPDC090091]|uniref:AAA family ATPase n=1 Tax=Kitasatospora sp. NPDC090091 TaxID=3364081 RepID=UPI00381BC228
MTLLLPPRRLDREVAEPTGIPAFPRLLLAGVEKSGKSYAAAEAAKSDLIGTTFWLEIGEDTAEEYKQLGPYKIVKHDGSYMDILDAVRYAVAQPRGADGKPNMIVIDSVTMLWELLCDEQTAVARRRANERGAAWDSELTITADQWQKAKNRFKDIINTLKYHDGPVLLLARLEDVVLFEGDKPTRDRVWKVKAERSLAFECTAVVQLRARHSVFLTNVRSLNPDLSAMDIRPLPGFTVDKLFRDLGMDRRVTRSTYVAPNPEAFITEHAQRLDVLDDLPNDPNSEQLGELIRLSYNTGNPEYLNRLNAVYGHAWLSRRQIKGKNGMVLASDAIEAALNALAQRARAATSVRPDHNGAAAAAATSAAQAVPAQDEQPQCTVPRCPTPEDRVRPYPNGARCEQHSPRQQAERRGEAAHRAFAEEWGTTAQDVDLSAGWPPFGFTGDDDAEEEGDEGGETDAAAVDQEETPEPPNPVQMLRNEAVAQARVLGITVDTHLAPLAPPGSTPGQLPPSRLGAHLLTWRPVVAAKLREEGHDGIAEQYAKLGRRMPSQEAADILNASA